MSDVAPPTESKESILQECQDLVRKILNLIVSSRLKPVEAMLSLEMVVSSCIANIDWGEDICGGIEAISSFGRVVLAMYVDEIMRRADEKEKAR